MEAFRRVRIPNYSQCSRISVLYTVLFLLYSYYHSTSLLFQFAFAIVIFKSVHESMKTNRYSELRFSIYDVFQLGIQLLGDALTIPYHILFNPRETPHIYFQRTTRNMSLVRNMEPVLNSYAPTPVLKNAIVQFSRLCFYEESPISWSLFNRSKYHIKRECITLDDDGLIALDWWIKPSLVQQKPQHFNYCRYFNKRNHIEYKSRLYYQYDHALYADCFRNVCEYPQGEATPVLLVFATFAGDSLSAPTQLVCDYFAHRKWRVVVYVKRGCGSFTQHEFLPLNTLKPFCLRGETDYDVVINLIQRRYPRAPKMLLGLSIGGAYVQTILGNKKYDGIFCGGIKIDAGMDFNQEIKDLDERQPFIGMTLAQIFKDRMIKCKEHKSKHGVLESDPYYKQFKWDKISNEMKNKEELTGLLWSIKRFVCPSYGYGDDVDEYLDWVKPGGLEKIRSPLLILDSWNDFMRNRKHILKDFSKRNEKIIHVINERGAHCMRREGVIGNKCWISKVAFVFSSCVINQHTKRSH